MHLVAALAFLLVASMALVATYLIALSRTWLAARGLSLERAANDYAAWFHLASMAVILLLFVATVKYFTGRRAPTRFAFAGGGLFVVLWYAARALSHWYLSSVASTSVIYGSLATLVVLVLWIYYSSCVFLLSAEFVKVLRGKDQVLSGRQEDRSV
jgi:membrane protein